MATEIVPEDEFEAFMVEMRPILAGLSAEEIFIRGMQMSDDIEVELDEAKTQLAAAKARVTELEAKLSDVPMMAIEICIDPKYPNTYKVVQKWLAQNGFGRIDDLRNPPAHEVIDDYGDDVTAVTL